MKTQSLDAMMAAACEHHRAGRLAEAEAIYRQVLAEAPGRANALHFYGLLASQVGQPGVAADLLQRATVAAPERADAWADLGNAWQAIGRFAEAADAYRRAIELQPNLAEARNNLGALFHRLGRFDDAVEAFKSALELQPAYAAAWSNLGRAYKSMGRFVDAVAAHDRASKINPLTAGFQHNLGDALAANGQPDEAISAYREALRLDRRLFATWNELGSVLLAAGRNVEAIECYREAVRVKPDFAAAFSNLGNALWRAGKLDDAMTACREAIRLAPEDAAAHNNLGNVLTDRERTEEAIGCYREAIRLDPRQAAPFGNLGDALGAIGRLDEAVEACQRALMIDPNLASAHNSLGSCRKGMGLVDDAVVCFRKAVDLSPSPTPHSNLVCALHFQAGCDAASIVEEARRWDRLHGQPLKAVAPPTRSRSPADRRLRIGYVSSNFRRHVVGQNLLPLLRCHDHERFEIFCYSDTWAPDALTEEIRSASDGWRDITGLSDEEAAERIRADEVDILLDLTMHMARNRLLVFARKPAPIQVAYLAFCSTTGLGAMDYRLSDPYLDPAGADLSVYTEKTVRLPRTYWCYEPLAGDIARPVKAPPPHPGRVTFGCLNDLAKVSKPALDLWGEILAAAPGADLVLYAPEGSTRSRIVEHLAHDGVDRSRVRFYGKQSAADYMKTWGGIDIGLDPFPYAGGISTCDALWMGTPVVTLSGKTVVGRGGCSILSNLGLSDMIARDDRQYVEIALGLANDVDRLGALRASLRERMERSPLRDAAGFAREMEEAYLTML